MQPRQSFKVTCTEYQTSARNKNLNKETKLPIEGSYHFTLKVFRRPAWKHFWMFWWGYCTHCTAGMYRNTICSAWPTFISLCQFLTTSTLHMTELGTVWDLNVQRLQFAVHTIIQRSHHCTSTTSVIHKIMFKGSARCYYAVQDSKFASQSRHHILNYQSATTNPVLNNMDFNLLHKQNHIFSNF